jgi:gamma-carbonic anhydrase
MPIIPFKGMHPKIGSNVFIAPDAWVIGNVVLADDVSVFFGAVLRGDVLGIRVGRGSNIQELSVLHTSEDMPECVVAEDVTVGHRAILHSCTVKDRCVIGMNSTILDGAEIGEESIVGAQALVKMRMQVPPRSLIVGVPAAVARKIGQSELDYIKHSAQHYRGVAREYMGYFDGLRKVGTAK